MGTVRTRCLPFAAGGTESGVMQPSARRVLVLAGVVLLAACSLEAGIPPPECGLPPGTTLAFAGLTTLNQLGLVHQR
jgi:hypothetical protein